MAEVQTVRSKSILANRVASNLERASPLLLLLLPKEPTPPSAVAVAILFSPPLLLEQAIRFQGVKWREGGRDEVTTSGRPTSSVEWSGRDSFSGMSGISGFESHSPELAKWPPEPVVANAKCR